MAKQGFYEIRTYENLGRDFTVTNFGFDTMHKKTEEIEPA